MKENLKSRRDRINAKRKTILIDGEVVYEDELTLIVENQVPENKKDNKNQYEK